jgi:hypothetical protein
MVVAPATTVTDPDALAGLGLAVPAEDHVAPAAQFRRVPNQRSVPEGQIRLYCDACVKSFTADADALSATCPEGHRPGDKAESKEDATS